VRRLLSAFEQRVSDKCAMLNAQVPPHHVWLQGDNTRNSNDSRHYGPVPTALLRGRMCFRMWPPRQIGSVSADSKFLIHRI